MVLGRPFDEHQYLHRKAQGNLRYVTLDPAMPDEAVDVDAMMEHVWIVGDPQDPDDHALMQRSLRLLMEEVAPRVQDLA
jgi:hypothetical protein